MNKTLIFRKIGGIISEISEQYQYLAEDPENINPLELELFVANSHFLSEHLAILKKLYSDPNAGLTGHSPRHVKLNEPLLSMNIPELERDEQVLDLHKVEPALPQDSDTIIHIPDAEKHDSDLDDRPGITSEKTQQRERPSGLAVDERSLTTTETVEIPVSVLSDSSEPKPVSARRDSPKESSEPGINPAVAKQEVNRSIEDRVPTLNEVLSATKKTETVSLNITSNLEKDLKSMIKLNDKLMFVRDLFNGYSLAYSEAIDFINRLDNFEAADKFLKQNYAEKNRWSEKQNSVDQFYEVLTRRFS